MYKNLNLFFFDFSHAFTTFFAKSLVPSPPSDQCVHLLTFTPILSQYSFKTFENNGYGNLPVCIAKTQYSFSVDPKLKGAPSGHEIPIREVRLSSGAEFIVVVCGSIMTMPGLPRVPAADSIKLNDKGEIEGLF